MLQLTAEEAATLRFQSGTLKTGRGQHRKYHPHAFTEQGVAMLSSVLRIPHAVRVNIEIMRAFVRLRQLLAGNAELAHRLAELERRVGDHDQQFIAVIAPDLFALKTIGWRKVADLWITDFEKNSGELASLPLA